jgi:hypothetical protein
MSEEPRHEDPLGILSAVLDGEDVDAARLLEALERPGALDAMKDIARLRAAIRKEAPTPSEDFYARMGSVLRPARGRAWRAEALSERAARPPRHGRLLAALAAATVLVVVGGALGWKYRERLAITREAPPVPARIVTFEPGVDWK